MARSRRRRGLKMPGVSTSTIWASPSMATPRTGKRVVWTFWVTMETLCADQTVDQGRLAGVGRADHGDEAGAGRAIAHASRLQHARTRGRCGLFSGWRDGPRRSGLAPPPRPDREHRRVREGRRARRARRRAAASPCAMRPLLQRRLRIVRCRPVTAGHQPRPQARRRRRGRPRGRRPDRARPSGPPWRRRGCAVRPARRGVVASRPGAGPSPESDAARATAAQLPADQGRVSAAQLAFAAIGISRPERSAASRPSTRSPRIPSARLWRACRSVPATLA